MNSSSSESTSFLNRFSIVEKWTEVDLNSSEPFDVNKRYRAFFDNSFAAYPIFVGPNDLGFEVSTAQFAFGWITKDNKKEWHYRQKGNSKERVRGYESANYKVERIEYAEFELVEKK